MTVVVGTAGHIDHGKTVVVGTAGHIDHGKTALLRALTGIDADRLPEERRRGMTIDVGYAHLTLDSGAQLDFVDVPGHDRLVGNMLVGAGEIDAAMLVIAADEGPKAQTLEHLGLLDALGIDDGIVVLTKLDLLAPTDQRRADRAGEVEALLAPTTLAGVPVVAVSAVSGEGLERLLAELAALQVRLARHGPAPGGARLAVDRVFTAQGRGVVVTGSLRGGSVARAQSLRLEPGGRPVRIREAQVHGAAVEATPDAGRVALNLAGVERDGIERGMALVAGPAVRATTRLLVSLRPTVGSPQLVDGAAVRVHLGTAETLGRLRLAGATREVGVAAGAAGAASGGGGGEPGSAHDGGPGSAHGAEPATAGGRSEACVGALILAAPIPAALDDRFVLRRPSPATTIGGGRVLDPAPPARLVRRRLDRERLVALAEAREPAARFGALVAAHGVLARDRAEAIAAVLGEPVDALATGAGTAIVAGGFATPSVAATGEAAAMAAVTEFQAVDPLAPGAPLTGPRLAAAGAMRRAAPGAAITADDGAAIVAALVARGALVRDGDLVREPGRMPARPAALEAAMDRLEAALDVPAPPSLAETARSVGCPPEGVRALEAEGRIVRLEADLAYAAAAFSRLEAVAVAMAGSGTLTPAAYRDATGTSRRYALAILEELDGRGILRRGPDGHVLGPRAPRV